MSPPLDPPLADPPPAVDDAVLDALTSALVARGWASLPRFVPRDEVAALASEMTALRAAGGFRAAGVGRGASFALRPDVRRDEVCWIDPAAPSPAQGALLQRMETLRAALNRRLLLGLLGFEAHLSVYPPGSFYRRHVDRYGDASHRVLSAIVYLNESWAPHDGGLLRLVGLGGELADVLPEAGLLVLMVADRIPHEVLPTARERLSVTGWFTRRE